MDLSELQAVIRRDRKRVDDLGRLAGLVEVLVQSAGVPVDVQADDARIVVTVDVSGLGAAAVAPDLPDWGKIGRNMASAPDRPCSFIREIEGGDATAPELVTGPITDAERAIVREMVEAGATGKAIGERLNRAPQQLGGVIAGIRRAEKDQKARKRVLTPPPAKPAPAPEPAPAVDVGIPTSEPARIEPEPARNEPEPVPAPDPAHIAAVAKVPPVDPDVAPFAGDLPADLRIAQEWDARVAAVPCNALFDRAFDLDLMSCLSAGMSAKDYALTRELTRAEVAARFAALMGDAKRTIENQGHCVAALKRAVGSA